MQSSRKWANAMNQVPHDLKGQILFSCHLCGSKIFHVFQGAKNTVKGTCPGCGVSLHVQVCASVSEQPQRDTTPMADMKESRADWRRGFATGKPHPIWVKSKEVD